MTMQAPKVVRESRGRGLLFLFWFIFDFFFLKRNGPAIIIYKLSDRHQIRLYGGKWSENDTYTTSAAGHAVKSKGWKRLGKSELEKDCLSFTWLNAKISYNRHRPRLFLSSSRRFDVEPGHGDRQGLCCRVFGGIIRQFSSISRLASPRDWPRLNVLFLFFSFSLLRL